MTKPVNQPMVDNKPDAPRDNMYPNLPMEQLNFYMRVLLSQVKEAVERRKAVDDDPDNNFRGLYITEKDVERVLVAGGWPPIFPDLGQDEESSLIKVIKELNLLSLTSPIVMLEKSFGLDASDIALLLTALAPDVDRKFEVLYGYLNDDVTKRRATIALALELVGLEVIDPLSRARLGNNSPLVSRGLITIEDKEMPFLARSLKVPDRVTAFLLGDNSPAHELLPFLDHFLYEYGENILLSQSVEKHALEITSAIKSGVDFIYLHTTHGSMGKEIALLGLKRAGLAYLAIDTLRFQKDTDCQLISDVAGREAKLIQAGIIVGPVDTFINTHQSFGMDLIRFFTEQDVPVILYGHHSFDPRWSKKVALSLQLEPLRSDDRSLYWEKILGDLAVDHRSDHDKASFLDNPASQRMSFEQIWRTATAAKMYAETKQTKLDKEAMVHAIRSENTAGLEKFATRIQPAVDFDDLVLPKATTDLLWDLVSRVKYRELVLGQWNMRAGAGRGQGVSALFAGDSGTGKTMSAEVIAKTLGFELYTINLSTVVDKYIGETEKHLERIFAELDNVNAVLLFDEADAIFGKRSEVKDAHDRYANIEVAYLLQKLESFDGLALLSTNLRAGIDEAFTRRLDAVVEFSLPDKEQRLVLWRRFLSKIPVRDDIDFEFLAEQFELSGGNISSVSLTAAYMAASRNGPLEMADIVLAIHREYKKLGRLSVRQEFGKWLDILDTKR